MSKKEINFKDIPETFDIKITEKLVDYSVALGRIRNNDAKTFQPLGSGTLVHKGGQYGILTAHHCLHQISPEFELGRLNSDKLICVLKGGNPVVIENYEISEMQLAYPEDKSYGESGPDLTFINIPDGPRLSTFKAISSFWSLDTEPDKIKKKFCDAGNMLVNLGFPEADYIIESTEKSVSQKIKLMSYINVLANDDVKYINEWDYIDSNCNYVCAKEAPRSFRGLSGGGIWAIKLKFDKDIEEFGIRDFALVGTTFYQTAIENEMRSLRGHFIGSIYKTAWENRE